MTEALDRQRPRNARLVDWWSLTHVAWGIILSILAGPFLALLLLTLWEPFEVLVLSPLAARRGVEFGHESFRNSFMDLAFNAMGVLLAVTLVFPFIDELPLWSPSIPGL